MANTVYLVQAWQQSKQDLSIGSNWNPIHQPDDGVQENKQIWVEGLINLTQIPNYTLLNEAAYILSIIGGWTNLVW